MKTKILCYEGMLTDIDVDNTFLQRSECDILTCKSGTEIVELAEEFRPELVLIDEAMPGLDGLEVVRSILCNPDLNMTRVLLIFEDESGPESRKLEESDRLAFAARPIDALLFLKKLSKLMDIPTRVHVRTKVVFEAKGRTAENELFYGRMLDISTGGFLFQLDRPLKLGDIIYCFFSLARNEQLIFASGRIVRFAGMPESSHYLYGVEFVNLRADDRRRIAEFIFRHSYPGLVEKKVENLTGYNVTFV
jgi:CheY-like chemotaxis protein